MKKSKANKNDEILFKSFIGQHNTLVIHRPFIDLTGSLECALFLSQCIYWSFRTDNPHGFAKSYNDWFDEIGLSKRVTEKAVKTLKKLGYITTKTKKSKYHNFAPVLHYSIALERIKEGLIDLEESQNEIMESNQTSLSESNQTSLSKVTKRHKHNTETIAETIAETKKTNGNQVNSIISAWANFRTANNRGKVNKKAWVLPDNRKNAEYLLEIGFTPDLINQYMAYLVSNTDHYKMNTISLYKIAQDGFLWLQHQRPAKTAPESNYELKLEQPTKETILEMLETLSEQEVRNLIAIGGYDYDSIVNA